MTRIEPPEPPGALVRARGRTVLVTGTAMPLLTFAWGGAILPNLMHAIDALEAEQITSGVLPLNRRRRVRIVLGAKTAVVGAVEDFATEEVHRGSRNAA